VLLSKKCVVKEIILSVVGKQRQGGCEKKRVKSNLNLELVVDVWIKPSTLNP
jgi:hypothetical protein